MINEIKSKSFSTACHLVLGDRFCSTVPAYRLLVFDCKLRKYVLFDKRRYTLDLARFLIMDAMMVFPCSSYILQPCYV